MHVISIQSQVVHGHVGNSAAVFPMQARGVTVAAVPTTLLSNHPHYPTLRGRVLEAELVADLLVGVEERGLVDSSSVLLTGYLGSVDNAEVVLAFAERALKINPALRFVCDPVMGDDDLGIFVRPGLVEVFRDRLVPMAAVITPNQYEVELLAGRPARTAGDLAAAAELLRQRGTGAVVATGCVLDDTAPGQVETIYCAPDGLQRHAVRRLPIRPCGTGDLFTGLLVAGLAHGQDLASATASANAQVFVVLERTERAGSTEMILAEA